MKKLNIGTSLRESNSRHSPDTEEKTQEWIHWLVHQYFGWKAEGPIYNIQEETSNISDFLKIECEPEDKSTQKWEITEEKTGWVP